MIFKSIYLNVSQHFWLVVFHWTLSDHKSPLVSRTLLSIPVDLISAVVCMVSILLQLAVFCSCLLMSLSRTPTTISIPIIFVFIYSAPWQTPNILYTFLFISFPLYDLLKRQNLHDDMLCSSCFFIIII